MFIYSVRASTLKFFGVVLLSVAALIALIIFVPTIDTDKDKSAFTVGSEISYDNIKTNEDRISFLSQFGWTVEESPKEEESVTIPDQFDKVYTGYNDIQKSQGLDLSKYKRKEVKRYTYVVTNYPEYEGTVYANILVYRDRIIGGDICSADVAGFVHGFEKSTS